MVARLSIPDAELLSRGREARPMTDEIETPEV